jgi:hypothetical protein
MAAIVEFSLYSEGHCRRIIHELVDQGWLEQTGDPGPGVAAEFCIPGVNAAHHARSEDENTAHPDARGTPRTMRAEKPQRRANAAHTPRIQTRAVESASLFSPITSTSTKAPAPPPSSATRSPGEILLRDWWEQQTPRPSSNFVGARKIVDKLLKNGWSEPELRAALDKAPTISTGCLEIALKGVRNNGHGQLDLSGLRAGVARAQDPNFHNRRTQ